jgi:hypothetical protein
MEHLSISEDPENNPRNHSMENKNQQVTSESGKISLPNYKTNTHLRKGRKKPNCPGFLSCQRLIKLRPPIKRKEHFKYPLVLVT